MTKSCPKCGETTYSDKDTHCAKCGSRYDRKSFLDPNNARITVTIPKGLRDELAKEAAKGNMILSEYAAHVLRSRWLGVHDFMKELSKAPNQAVIQPGWNMTAGFAAEASWAILIISAAGMPVSFSAHSGV